MGDKVLILDPDLCSDSNGINSLCNRCEPSNINGILKSILTLKISHWLCLCFFTFIWNYLTFSCSFTLIQSSRGPSFHIILFFCSGCRHCSAESSTAAVWTHNERIMTELATYVPTHFQKLLGGSDAHSKISCNCFASACHGGDPNAQSLETQWKQFLILFPAAQNSNFCFEKCEVKTVRQNIES